MDLEQIKHLLAHYTDNIYVKEHILRDIEENIKVLLPISKAAKALNLKMRLTGGDKLLVNSQQYTTDTLHLLPDNLKPENLAAEEVDRHTLLYSDLSPVSNFSGARFVVDDIENTHSEQYILEKKSTFFNDHEMVRKVVQATNPATMKMLTDNLPTFNKEAWEQ